MERENLVRLVIAAQNDDQQALNELFNAFYNDVYYFALKTVKDETLACDITQDSFVDMINGLSTLQEPAAFVAWMKQITYHQCTRHFRKKKDVLVDEDEDGNTIFDIVAEDRAEFIPDEALDQQDFRKTILAMLDELSEEQRAATLLYYYDELSVKQIAEIQGVSEGTVKSRLNYARKSIKTSVEAYEKKNNVKLHSFAFLPFMFWLLKGAAEESTATATAALPAVASGVSVATGATLAASTASTAAVAGSVATGAVASGVAAKIVAGFLAVAVAIGGTAVYLHEEQTGEPTEQTSITTAPDTTNTTPPNPSETTAPETTVPQPSLNDLAMEAYDELLQRGYTDNSLQINYYTYIDIDQDGLPELIVADNKGTPDAWTTCELYSYNESGLVFCGENSARYTYLYHVNGTYLMGTYRWGEVYLSTSGRVEFEEAIYSSEIIELKETPYDAFDIGVTEAEILQIFYAAKDFYDTQVYGKRFFDSSYYSASDFDWIEGIIEYNGGLYAPCDEYTYDEFVQKLHAFYSSDIANILIGQVGLLEYNGQCYTYIREGVGDLYVGDYGVSVQLQGNVLFEIQISFADLDGNSITEYIYCQKEDDSWVLDGINFYGG